MTRDPWDRRIQRANELAERWPTAAEILRFYVELAKFQRTIYGPNSWQGDIPEHLLERRPPPHMSDIWLAQPVYEYQASQAVLTPGPVEPVCPFCASKPVAGVLRGEGEGAKRHLLCSLCSTEWEYRRVICPNCGEEDQEKLPIYQTPEIPHVRIDACDTCHTYIKSVDLTKDGHAVPVVDEIAAVSLALWSEDHGYTKLTPNILGM